MPRAEHKLIINLAQKWQQKPIWLLASDLAKHTVESPGDDSGYLQYAQSFSELQNELANLENLIRYNVPELLYLSPFVELLVDYKSLDIDQRIRDLRKIESSVRQIDSATGRDDSAEETDAEAMTAHVNPWDQARQQNSKITVSDQMLTLFKDDDSIVDRKGLSDEVAKILGCTAGAVRNATAWNFYRTEQARRKQIRQELKGKRWIESEQNDADD